MSVQRHRDWPPRLAAYLTQAARKEGRIGAFDCAIFAAGAVEAITGWQPDPALLVYDSEEHGHAALQAAGFDGVQAFVSAHFPDRPLAQARPGDLAWVVRDGVEAVGVVQGDQVYVASKGGVGVLRAASMTRCWGVG